MTSDLEVFVVLYDCIDFPGKYVVRVHYVRWGGVVPGDVISVTEKLALARASIPNRRSKMCFPRSPHCDPVIVESWI